MLYFVQDNKIHRFPAPKRCGCIRKNEPLRDTIPHDAEECMYCIRFWPGEDR